jgi:hypothetical protein
MTSRIVRREVKKKPAKIPEQTEKEFQRQVIQLAQLCGWKVAHFRPARVIVNGKETWRTPCEGDAAGFPDLVLAKRGAVFFFELKSDRGKVTDEQQKWLEETGGSVWRPMDWKLIEQFLRG